MVMTWFWSASVLISVCFCLFRHSAAGFAAALTEGAAQALTLSLALAGPLCLWSGLGRLMERGGLLMPLRRTLRPLLARLFPGIARDPELEETLCGNVCANLLGLGNAATPMGVWAAGRLRDPKDPRRATDGLCRLVVLNTASIQLLPTTVAAVRQSAGAASPFDILPCVWVSSLVSVCAGLAAAWIFGRVWRG